jgi:hypothetical protein
VEISALILRQLKLARKNMCGPLIERYYRAGLFFDAHRTAPRKRAKCRFQVGRIIMTRQRLPLLPGGKGNGFASTSWFTTWRRHF